MKSVYDPSRLPTELAEQYDLHFKEMHWEIIILPSLSSLLLCVQLYIKSNQCHSCRSVTLSGNGNLTLPNSTETTAVNSTGSALVNFETTSVIAQEL
jgi:hypothetical protein